MFWEFLKLWIKIFGLLGGFALCIWLVIVIGERSIVGGIFMSVFTIATFSTALIMIDW